uniref:non-specific serine/threonine protein kinase n=1 Tax=viral metagenome TaxID=1070528 RepID=A0A6C0I4D0_9ZZZZ
MIANKYSVGQLLGVGQFGSVYSGINEVKQEPVAIKVESKDAPIKLLKQEVTILQYLYSRGSRVTPPVHWFGNFLDYTCLIMPLYDHSLQDCEMTPDIMVACICALEVVHNLEILHCDIKPQNIMIKDGEVFLIDFGLATFNSSPGRPMNKMIGSSKYASYFIHVGGEPLGRRDDLISLGYIYLYKTTNYLQEVESYAKEFEVEVELDKTDLLHPINQHWKRTKELTNVTTCSGIPLRNYFHYCYRLSSPNYDVLKRLFCP